MSQVIWVNDQDIEADVTSVPTIATAPDSWGAVHRAERAVALIPGAYGDVLAPAAELNARTVRITVRIKAESYDSRDHQVALLSALFPLNELVELRFDDSPGKVLEGVVIAQDQTGISSEAPFRLGSVFMTFDVLCPNPTKRDRFSNSVFLAANQRSPIPLGTLDSAGVLSIGPSGGPPITITYRNAGGDTVAVLTITVTLGANDRVLVDLDTNTVTHIVNDVATVNNNLASGTWFVTSADDGDFQTSLWPSIESNVQGIYDYVKRHRT